MKLIKLECPYCGGELEADEGSRVITCSYCGRDVSVDDEVQREETTIHIKDEARLREAELIRQRYQDTKQRADQKAEEDRIRAFRKSRGAKVLIVFLIIAVMAVFAGFSAKHPLAGIIALGQTILLGAAWLMYTGHIKTIRGRKVPAFVLILLAGLLVIPYVNIYNRRVYEKYTWPDNTLAKVLPKPRSAYGEVLDSVSDTLRVRVDKTDENAYQTYLSACKEKGFTVDADESHGYEAYNENDYYLKLEYDRSDQEMTIRLSAPQQYDSFSWPVSSFSSILPQPVSDKGDVVTDRSDAFVLIVADTDEEARNAYIDALLSGGFDQDYERGDISFEAQDAEGNRVSVTKEGHRVMRIELQAAREETPQPTETPAPEPTETPSAVPEETAAPEPSETPETEKAPAASGVRPEFRRTMEDYEAFYDQYIAFMEKYSKSDDPASMMMDYLSLMNKLAEWTKKMDEIDESELSSEELLLLNEVNMRVATKLNAAAIRMN